MAAPNYSPKGGYGTTYTDRGSGQTYIFNQSGWSPISSGSNQNQSRGSVLGASIGPNYSTNTSLLQAPQVPQASPATDTTGQDIQSAFNPIRDQINSGYNDYFNQLNDISRDLSNQRNSQEQIVQNQYQQGVNTLDDQFRTGQRDLQTTRQRVESNQAKNLSDLSESLRNQFLTGQNVLGAQGAGDSSAVNQYSYALTKMGNKNRGDITAQTAQIQNDINDREFKLKSSYDTEIRNLSLERDNQIQGIAQWLSEQQNAIRQARATGELSRSQDIQRASENALQTAMQAVSQIRAESQNKRAALEQWAINQSQNIAQLKSNMSGVASYSPDLPAFQGINGTPQNQQQQATNLFGYGNREDRQNRPLFLA